jgi:hypothetical protein
MGHNRLAVIVAAAIAPMLAAIPAFAGGGGQNMLLVVNPNDENSLRMANAYAAARAIPENNILFIANPTAATSGYNLNTISYTAYNNTYKNTIPNAITARGLDGQIDYIGTIGTPHVVNGSAPNSSGGNTSIKMSFNYFLSLNTQFHRGMTYPDADYRPSELFKVAPSYTPAGGTPATLNYTKNTNNAIHWSTQYTTSATKPPGYNYVQWYMSGSIGYTGTFAITPEQYIAAYQRSVAADGTKPAGKVYFMENDDVRSETREYYWATVQKYMTENGIPWEQIRQQFDGSPRNKPDVTGAVIGAAGYNVPNGSTYLPGSYLDSLTSSGASYGSSGQTKADKVIRAGAAGTAGAVTEPFAIADRFTQSTFFIFNREGSTLGESYAMSVRRPDLLMFQGDLLSQAYADMPDVTMSGVSGSPVTGSLSISATATLNSPVIATGISKMELFVDGKSMGLLSNGQITLDTTTLTDGRHEVRVVAYNNAAAESQGYSLDYITVNNKGQSVASTGGSDFDVTWNQVLNVPVAAIQGNGSAVSRIELRSLGRVVGTLNAAGGNVAVDATKLAFGDNTLIPVAVLADGKEVRGEPIVVSRDFRRLAGRAALAPQYRTPGFKFEYFAAAAGNTLATTNFDQTPTVTQQGTILSFNPTSSNASEQNLPEQFKNGNNAKLAIRVTSLFNIDQAGEYTFWFGGGRFESLRLSIDGVVLQQHELWTGSTFTSANTLTGIETSESIYLETGEHNLQLLLANGGTQTDSDSSISMYFWYRGPDGDFYRMDSAMFYTAVPEPACAAWLAVGSATLLRRKQRKV